MMHAHNHGPQSQLKPLQRWGVIVVDGDDAGVFLQGQLTHHIQDLASNTLQMAGFCTAKGRLLGNFWVFRPPADKPTFWLLCRADIISALVKRLSMFVLRSKCKVTDGREHIHVAFEHNQTNINYEKTHQHNTLHAHIQWNIQDDGMHRASIALGPTLGSLDALKDGDAHNKQSCTLYIFCHTDTANSEHSTEPNPADDAFETYWTRQGLAFIQTKTVELFTPQAINYDLVGGVSFQKGCYPGQEVVARTHYLGKIKRRAVLCQLLVESLPQSNIHATQAISQILTGQDVWASTENREPVGQIIQVAFDGTQYWALVELPLEQVMQAALNDGIEWMIKTNQAEDEHSKHIVRCSVLPKPEWMPYPLNEKGNPFDTNISKI